MMATPRVVVDDPVLFPNVARIVDVMLRHVDPQNQLFVQHLASTDSSILTGVLPQKRAEGSSKAVKVPKKKKQIEKP